MKEVSVGGTISEKGKYIGKFCIIIGGLILDPVTGFFINLKDDIQYKLNNKAKSKISIFHFL